MPKHTDRPLTRSYSRAHDSLGTVQLPPCPRPARRTLSAVSELSEEGLVDLDVGFHSLCIHKTTNRHLSKPKTSLLATATEDELLRAGNVAYTQLLDAYKHAKQQHTKIE